MGSDSDELEETRHAFMRYVGQGHEIPVSLPVETCTDRHGAIFREAFESAYTKLYGRVIEGVEIEVLSWTLTISAPSRDQAVPAEVLEPGRPLPEPEFTQALFDPAESKRIDVPVYLRARLQPGDRLKGPALITEDQTTTVVTSHYRAEIGSSGHIVLTREENQGA
jgi:N-methylhydantoinase A